VFSFGATADGVMLVAAVMAGQVNAIKHDNPIRLIKTKTN
jgi:hypothetical protein